MDGEDSRNLRSWVAYCVKDIVELFTTNPDTLYGTINIGPDIQALIKLGMELDRLSDDDYENFIHLYKTLAVHIYYVLSRKLGKYISRAIDMGFGDVSCDVHRYNPGMLTLNLRAIAKFI